MASSQLQYTVRGVPPATDRALRRKARQRGISLNQLLVEELVAAAGSGETRKFRDISNLGRVWQDDPEFDRIVAEHRKIDTEKWK